MAAAVPFEIDLAELIGTGHAARGMLTAVERFCSVLAEETLKGIDRDVVNGVLNGEMALARCHELAAYRRIVLRLRAKIVAGEHAAARQAAAHAPPQEEGYA